MRDVESTGTGNKWAQDLVCGSHRLVADEPPADGGKDQGPSPSEYLSVALAACRGRPSEEAAAPAKESLWRSMSRGGGTLLAEAEAIFVAPRHRVREADGSEN